MSNQVVPINSTLIHGDCLKEMDSIAERCIDLVLIDPPYGTTDIKGWDKHINMEKAWEQINRVLKPDGTVAIFGSQPFSSFLVSSNPKMFRYEWIWDKTRGSNFLNSNCQPMKSHENIMIFTKLPASPNKKGTSKYNPQKIGEEEYTSKLGKRTDMFNGGNVSSVKTILKGRHPKSIQTFKKDGKLHPTQKPVALLEFLIKSYTNEFDSVLDFVMGSGSTGVACKNLRRYFTGIELDKKYFDIAKKRIEEA